MFDWHAQAEPYLIPAQLILAMVGMGATLHVRDFGDVVKNPGGLATGLALQWIVVPGVAVALAEALGLSPGWAVGLILVAVVPGGAFSNLLTYLGRGNTPLSISVTAVTTLGCIGVVPLYLRLLASDHLPADFRFPIQRIVVEIFAYLLIPLLVGMVVLRVRERWAPELSKWTIRGSLLLIVVITVGALGSGKIEVAEYGWGPPLRIIAFGVVLAGITPLVCRALRRYDDDAVALSVEVAVRNIGVGLLLVRFFFPDRPEQGHVLYTLLFYAGASMWFALPAVLRHRTGRSVTPLLRPHPRPR